jgi:hypothetical protein
MREDTSPETPKAKTNSDPPEPSPWRRPGQGGQATNALFDPRGARFDWTFGTGKVRTYQASGPAAVALTIVVLLVVGALVSIFFVFAIGIGTTVALMAGVVAALGLGARAVRRRLTDTRHGQLGSGER